MKTISTPMRLEGLISLNALSRATAAFGALMVAIGLVGCASETEPSTETQVGVGEFASLAGYGVDLDYEPLQDASDAVRRSDLIVAGRLTNVVDGIQIRHEDPALAARDSNTYVTFVIDVEQVVDGRAAVGDDVYVIALRNTAVTPDQLATMMPQAEAALVLDDVTDWTPYRTAVVERPDAIPSDARIFHAFADGFWLEGPGDTEMTGLFTTPSELTAGWEGVRTISEFMAQFN